MRLLAAPGIRAGVGQLQREAVQHSDANRPRPVLDVGGRRLQLQGLDEAPHRRDMPALLERERGQPGDRRPVPARAPDIRAASA